MNKTTVKIFIAIIKIILLISIIISYLVLIFGIMMQASNSATNYSSVQLLLICLSLTLVLVPYVYLLYKVKIFKDKKIAIFQ